MRPLRSVGSSAPGRRAGAAAAPPRVCRPRPAPRRSGNAPARGARTRDNGSTPACRRVKKRDRIPLPRDRTARRAASRRAPCGRAAGRATVMRRDEPSISDPSVRRRKTGARPITLKKHVSRQQTHRTRRFIYTRHIASPTVRNLPPCEKKTKGLRTVLRLNWSGWEGWAVAAVSVRAVGP